METKFTKGEWKISDPITTDFLKTEIPDIDKDICLIGVDTSEHIGAITVSSYFKDTTEANAKLIAAAPLLYKELKRLVRLLEPLELDGELSIPGLATLNGARNALKKATE